MFISRMARAAFFFPGVYEEIENDRGATGQALLVVVIVALIQGIGVALGNLFHLHGLAALRALTGGVVHGVIGWALFSLLAYIVGVAFFHGKATYGEVLRTLGFAYTPMILVAVALIPIIGWLFHWAIFSIAMLWFIAAVVIALREALDSTFGAAIITAVISVAGFLVVGWVLSLFRLGSFIPQLLG